MERAFAFSSRLACTVLRGETFRLARLASKHDAVSLEQVRDALMSDRFEDRSRITLQDRADTETILPIRGSQARAAHNARSVIIIRRYGAVTLQRIAEMG